MEDLSIREMPEDERPRERFTRLGPDSLSNRELLAIILRSGVRGKSALTLATELLAGSDGSLSMLSAMSVRELCRHGGIGPAKAIEIVAAFTLARRLAGETCKRPMANCPALVYAFMSEKFRNTNQEEFHVLLLDGKMQLIRDELVTMGLLDHSLIHAREVFRTAIRESSKSVIICHNHPSGDPRPSKEDVTLTRSLAASGDIIGIEVLDHIIIANAQCHGKFGNYYSFAERGMMKSGGKKQKQ